MILIVDSEKTLRHFLTSMIKDQLERPTIGADSGHEMEWHLDKTIFDLLLIRPNLPDKDAFELIAKVRSQFSRLELPIILLSGKGEHGVITRGFEVGVNDCITLPFDPVIAISRVKNQLSLKTEFLSLRTDLAKSNPSAEPDPLPDTDTHSAMVNDTESGFTLSQQDEMDEETFTKTQQTLETVYQRENDTTRPIPCEMPLSLFIGPRSFFCKTIWISLQEILLLTFEEFPKGDSYQLQLLHPAGSTVDITVVETQRKPIQDHGAGVLKLHLKITNAPVEYDALYQLFRRAFQADGLSGLKAVLRGEEVTPGSSLKQHPDATMVAFSTAATSLNVTKGHRYKFIKQVGKGGFASVYLVRDNALNREVAMKVLNHDFSKLAEARTSFLGEAQIAAQFHHPNIVFVFEVGELFQKQYKDHLDFPGSILSAHPERLIYFTMQYVEGKTLTQWIRSNEPPKEKECISVMMEAARALAFAHEKGVIHRDIKPDNIMISSDNHVLVTDFGIATLARTDPNPSPKKKGGKIEIACTPKYASPEQLRGKTLDGRSDIYSLGILAYEMLTGSPPFRGKSLSDIVEQQLKSEPEPLKNHGVSISPALDSIIYKCLTKDLEKRFQNADELLGALHKLVGAAAGPVKRDPLETLDTLLSQVILVKTAQEAARCIEQLTAFLHLQKTYDNVEQIAQIKNRLTDPSMLNLLIEQNLNHDNQQLLYDFFIALDSNRAVLNILQWFRKEKEPWKKSVLGELAVLCAGRELMPLAVFGLELGDIEASILLKSFGEAAPQCREPVFLKWSRHKGKKTQQELLKIISIANRPDDEVIRILEYLAREGGSHYNDVKEVASTLLNERQKAHV